MKEKILILGGTEFVGRQLVEQLIAADKMDVYLFNRGKTNPHLFPKATQIIGDRETADIEKLQVHQWDYIVDFSSYYPKSLKRTLDCINKDVKKYIYISTISVYDFPKYDGQSDILENFIQKTCSPEEAVDTTMKTYGQKKVACEAVLQDATWLNAIILRPSIIYGRHDPTDRFYYWLRQVKEGGNIILPDNGQHQLSLTYANDLVDIILNGIEGKLPLGVYNCSTGPALKIKEVLDTMKKLLDSPCKYQDVAVKELKEKGIHLPLCFAGNLKVSDAKLSAAMNSSFTPFVESVKEVIAHYESENWRACKISVLEKLN